MKKLSMTEVVKKRNEVIRKITDYKKKVNAEVKPIIAQYLKENCKEKVGKVYEVVEGVKRKGYKRFAVYGRDLNFFDWSAKRTTILIRVGGWWLDDNNTPAIFDDRTVHGVGNPTVFKLSENQKNNPVPLHLMGRGR